METQLSGEESGQCQDDLFIAAEGGSQRWCKFSVLVSARDGRRRNDALLKDEEEAVSSS
jgi:hypothetical protein